MLRMDNFDEMQIKKLKGTIIEKLRKIDNKLILIKIHTMIEFWNEQQEKKED